MCGILFVVSENQERVEVVEESLLPLLHHRGPDAKCVYSITDECAKREFHFHGTVLHLRGELTQQPLVSKEGHVLLWNGEIFGGDVQVAEDANDTFILFEKLQLLPLRCKEEEYRNELISIFASIQGPWAFVFYDAFNKNIWYGRDYFGRRSLMSSFKDNTFTLSSLGHRRFADEFTEVPAKMLYCLNTEKLFKEEINDSIKSYPIEPCHVNIKTITNNLYIEHRCLNSGQCENHDTIGGNEDLEDHRRNHSIDGDEQNLKSENSALCSCVKSKHCSAGNHDEPPSGSITSNINHARNQTEPTPCCHCLFADRCTNTDTELINKQDSCTSVGCKNSKSNMLTSFCTDCNRPIQQDSSVMSVVDTRHQFLCVLEEAVRKRVYNIPRVHCRNNSYDGCKVSKVGILFSGGIDSVVLTALADRCTPPWESIDLINVAFAQKQKVQQNVKKKHLKPIVNDTLNFDVPDRITGKTALKELPKKRQWNFIEVDVTLEELQEQRKCRITNLVYPLDSVLDDSIGCAIWFAARGVGRCYVVSEDDELQLVQENYESPVKVLLTGMGADEQLGGYARHRTKFDSSGWVGLQTEMEMELERISSRNLGRDDRCISDHGREARFPFLDENVVSFLQNVPVCVKCDPRLPRGFGEKILLREVASSLGLPYASKLPKRAIQFGSKIAKLEGSKEKGSDNCKRLENIQLS